MIAIDTSIVVRIAVGVHPKQKQAALTLLETATAFVAKTVLLETEWVLRSRYGIKPRAIHAFLHYLVESAGLYIEDDLAVRRALDFYLAGADFADAMHLASSDDCVMHTFDRAFCRSAIKKGIAPAAVVLQATA